MYHTTASSDIPTTTKLLLLLLHCFDRLTQQSSNMVLFWNDVKLHNHTTRYIRLERSSVCEMTTTAAHLVTHHSAMHKLFAL